MQNCKEYFGEQLQRRTRLEDSHFPASAPGGLCGKHYTGSDPRTREWRRGPDTVNAHMWAVHIARTRLQEAKCCVKTISPKAQCAVRKAGSRQTRRRPHLKEAPRTGDFEEQDRRAGLGTGASQDSDTTSVAEPHTYMTCVHYNSTHGVNIRHAVLECLHSEMRGSLGG